MITERELLNTDVATAPAWPAASELPIRPVFALGDTWYYRFPEGDLPVGRAFAARAYFEELEMRCTREHLLQYCEAQKACLNRGDLMEAARLTAELRDRVDWIFAPDTVYKLAAVVYFDVGEDPYAFDFAHAARKMERWKAAEADFFVARPVLSLLPYSGFTASDMQAWLWNVNRETQAQADHILRAICS